MRKQSEFRRELTYTKDPNKCIPDDDPSIKDKHLFVYKNGTLRCEELDLECVAMGMMYIQMHLPGGVMIQPPQNCEHFTSAHFVSDEDLKVLKEKGVFSQETWNKDDE